MEEFIRKLMEQIRCAKAREGVAQEIEAHIMDQAAAYEKDGVSHEEAVAQAVREMGDPVEIGIELDAVHRPKLDAALLGMTFVGSILGLLFFRALDSSYLFPRQCLFTLLGFGVVVGVCLIDYTFIGRWGSLLYGAVTVLLLVGALGIFPQQAKWIQAYGHVPGMTYVSYLYVPLFVGVLYRFKGKGMRAVAASVGLLLATSLITWGFSGRSIVAVNLYLINILLLLAAIGKGWFSVKRGRAAAVAAAAFFLPLVYVLGRVFLAEPDSYMLMRIRAFWNPAAYAFDSGYIYERIQDVLRGAELIGADVAAQAAGGQPIWSFYADLQLLYIVQSYGLIAGLAVVAALLAFALRAGRIVRRQTNELGYLLSLGCLLVFGLNCIEGILMNFGWFPATTTFLPFLTHGGSATLVYAVLIGLLLSVHRYENVAAAPKPYRLPFYRQKIRAD